MPVRKHKKACEGPREALTNGELLASNPPPRPTSFELPSLNSAEAICRQPVIPTLWRLGLTPARTIPAAKPAREIFCDRPRLAPSGSTTTDPLTGPLLSRLA